MSSNQSLWPGTSLLGIETSHINTTIKGNKHAIQSVEDINADNASVLAGSAENQGVFRMQQII
jgi:hypothetical protein